MVLEKGLVDAGTGAKFIRGRCDAGRRGVHSIAEKHIIKSTEPSLSDYRGMQKTK
jgi:hypothetical protein